MPKKKESKFETLAKSVLKQRPSLKKALEKQGFSYNDDCAIVGVDPSSSHLGLSITHIGGTPLESKVFSQKGTRAYLRIENILDELNDFIFSKYPSCFVFIEDHAYGKSFHANDFAEVTGIVAYNFHLKRVPSTKLSISTSRRFVCSNGRADKDKVANKLRDMYPEYYSGLPIHREDGEVLDYYDAHLLSHFGKHILDFVFNETLPEKKKDQEDLFKAVNRMRSGRKQDPITWGRAKKS